MNKIQQATQDYFNEQLSKNFQRWEFACKGNPCCGRSAPISRDLIHILQALRNCLGVPLKINRGFSCQIHNMKLQSKLTSDHCLGLAADVAIPPGIDVEDIKAEAITWPKLGAFGMYDTHFHIAVERRPSDPLKEWDNRTPKEKTEPRAPQGAPKPGVR